MPTDTLPASAARARAATAAIPVNVAEYVVLSDDALIELSRVFSEHQRQLNGRLAIVAGEIARRSAPSFGHAGLAQRTGHRTPEELLKASTGSTAREASTVLKVGRLVHEVISGAATDPRTGAAAPPTQPWLQPVGVGVADGELSVSAAEAIASGLGEPNEQVPMESLRDAAVVLCAEAATLDADRLHRRARDLRDELDQRGIADRERERRQKRSLRLVRLSSGMSRIIWDLDPESAAVVGDLYDRATSPRRGGVRFVDVAAAQHARQILEDTRSTDQLASDVFLELLQQGSAADSSRLLGSGASSVRVIVAAEDLGTRSGAGWLEGQTDAVSIQTVERHSCAGGVLPVVLDSAGQPLDVGREQRLYTRRQRVALAIRDGGCRAPGCDRPPSWCEAHHIRFWHRDSGGTDVADGVLLCRHHHLLFHDHDWEILREGAEYWLIPPPTVDPERRPRPMPSKSEIWRKHQRDRVPSAGLAAPDAPFTAASAAVSPGPMAASTTAARSGASTTSATSNPIDGLRTALLAT